MRQLDSIFKTLSIFGLIVLVFASCGTEPEFERESKSDPSSIDFTPKTGDLSVSLKANKEVHIEWLDISDYEDGYNLWKKLGETGHIVRLAELEKNTNSFVDDSGEIDITTTYYVAAISKHRQNFDSLNVKNSLLFFEGGINDLEFTRNEKNFLLGWNNTAVVSEFVTVKRLYQDGASEILDTLDRSAKSFEFVNQIDDYWTQVEVSSYFYNHEGEHQQQSSLTSDRLHYNLPRFVSIEFINEAIAKIVYEDNSDFEDKINVYQRTRIGYGFSYDPWELIGTINQQNNTVQITSTSHSLYQFRIAAYYNGKESIYSDNIMKSPGSRAPNNIQIDSIANQTIRINWNDVNQTVTTYKYILQRKTGRFGTYSTIAELEPSETSFIVDDVSQVLVEQFRIRTYSSGFSYFTYDGTN